MIPLLLAVSLAVRATPASSPGRSAVPADPPAAPGALGPNLTAAGDKLLLSWLEPRDPSSRPGEGEMALRYAAFDGQGWSEPRTVLSSPKILANWADFPALAQSARGWLAAGWPEKSGSGAYDYLLELARADSLDSPWKRLGPAHEDRTASEHGFVSLVPEGDAVRAFWLDGRQMQGDRGSMSLRTTRIGERPEPSELLDARVCDCCQISAAASSEGPLVVYRDRSEGEVRDIAIVRRSGGRWTTPRIVAADGWKIDGCPVNGPSVATSGREVAVAWFTAVRERPRVFLAFSRDAGAMFGPPVPIDADGPAGRVSLALDENGDAIVAWVAAEGKGASIRVRRVTVGGDAGPPFRVAATSLARSSGFPRIARRGAMLLVAWVEASDPFRLRASAVPVSAIPEPAPPK